MKIHRERGQEGENNKSECREMRGKIDTSTVKTFQFFKGKVVKLRTDFDPNIICRRLQEDHARSVEKERERERVSGCVSRELSGRPFPFKGAL